MTDAAALIASGQLHDASKLPLHHIGSPPGPATMLLMLLVQLLHTLPVLHSHYARVEQPFYGSCSQGFDVNGPIDARQS